jgi:3-hydroxyisobutyrate dehydrogenase-like beta-hydroxyacid dehydrogenase
MKIGFIGLGKMGLGIAGHLLAGGHELHVWNRSAPPARELGERGARVARTPVELADAEFIMTMLANDEAVRAVLLDQGLLEAARPGCIHINLATVSIALTRELAQLHAQRRIGYVAAPVFGRPDVAAAGKLNVVAAAERQTLERARAALEAVGQKVWLVGEQPEKASAVKIAGNFMIAAAIETMGEAVALTRSHGVGADEFLQVMTNTLFAAPVYKGYGSMISEQRYEPAGFPAPLALKDIRLALAAADERNVPLPFASVLRDGLLEIIATGGAHKDWSALAALAARRGGLDGH